MRLPSLLRAHATFPSMPHLSNDDIFAALARDLERSGAQRVVIGPDALSFDASAMPMNVSPLAACDFGEFTIRRDAGRTRIEHGLTLDVLTGPAALCLTATAALCAWMLFYGRFAPVVIAALFYLGGIVGSYFFHSGQLAETVRRCVPSPAPARRGFLFARADGRSSA